MCLSLALPLLLAVWALPFTASAQALIAAADEMAHRSVSEVLWRMHEASRRRAYTGTLVVSSGAGMSSAKVSHVCDGEQQMERVESLTGTPRTTFRHNDEVITLWPQSRMAIAEKRESLGSFPSLLKTPDASVDQYYSANALGSERVAGLDTDVLRLQPRDSLRFGYRIWSEKRTGLVLKMQTLDAQGKVLEQVAFSDLQLDAPVNMAQLKREMAHTEGYRLQSPTLVKTTPAAEGWRLSREVPGFHAMSCHRRLAAATTTNKAPPAVTVQWAFSDGLATVSVFIEPLDLQRHGPEGVQAMGATHVLTRRLTARGGLWWLTVVGEAPTETLQAFARAMERLP